MMLNQNEREIIGQHQLNTSQVGHIRLNLLECLQGWPSEWQIQTLRLLFCYEGDDRLGIFLTRR